MLPLLNREQYLTLLVGSSAAVVSALVLVENFLLFHAITEILSILIAFAVFILVWNAADQLDDPYLAVLGIGYLFIGGIDLLHTLAYKGMGVFPAAGADLPTQLWVFGRGIEAFTLVGAGVLSYSIVEHDAVTVDLGSRQLVWLAGGYTAVVGFGLASIFAWDVFPTAYVAGEGLTTFKIYSEYAIIGLFGVALGLLVRQRAAFSRRIFQLLAASLMLSMVSELAFTLYIDVYDLSNAVGHTLKICSFYLLYLAIVKTSIKEPQRTFYRRLAERESEARKFEKAADYSGHAILITDRDGTIQYVNRAWEELTGYTAEECVGMNPRLVSSGKHDDAFYEDLWATIFAGETWEGNVVNVDKDGDAFVVHQTIAPVFGTDGDIENFVSINADISERVAYRDELEEDLQRSADHLQVLDRVLRHNIRNELNIVLGYAEMLGDGEADTDRVGSRIQGAGTRLLNQVRKERRIVNLLLDPPSPVPTDLTVVVTSVVDQFEERFPDATFAVEMPDELSVETIPELELALVEVVENAVVHTDSDTPRVDIALASTAECVEIVIEDDGPGIPAVERELVTGREDIDALNHSSGMGLRVVNHIVSEAGGSVDITDKEPQGSVVTLTVPFSPHADEATPTASLN
ncbi:PAS domain S-box protein [Haloferax sp. MBLA0076]|uniref:histidine kinase n=1 Tax=Haloferax litoreum TaxID=2666140 RepID=A0A6A8GGR8_9EURY|nr:MULTISPECIES: MASE3 domain-containing protein [Haloferax]KAB1194006.1 PAS domain S-box protein [Haloferax sp. CBA1148]MRX22554.1 PAS domain S-box protein [Haloferax litoreum]